MTIDTTELRTIPTTDGAEVCCYGMLVAGNQHSDDCDEEKRRQARPAPEPEPEPEKK